MTHSTSADVAVGKEGWAWRAVASDSARRSLVISWEKAMRECAAFAETFAGRLTSARLTFLEMRERERWGEGSGEKTGGREGSDTSGLDRRE